MNSVIRVYDDVEGRGERYAERLRKLEVVRRSFDEVESIRHKDLREELQALRTRQTRTRRGEKWDDETLILDETSILILDFDLLKTFEETFLTGEEVAYLARCFSECGLLVGLNIDIQKAGENPFDLTLRGHPESYCDLNIGSQQLDNKGLWGDETRGFRPWYWPLLPSYLNSFQDRVSEVANHLDDPICETIGIKELIKFSSRSVTEFIGGDPVKTTFREFVVKSGNGLRGRDKRPTGEMVARIATARVSKWLERLMLPGQDLLVDAPHLVSRYPSLLRGDHSDVSTWDKTTKFDTYENLDLDYERIEDFRLKKAHWLPRPAWFWPELSKSQKIKEIKEPWEREEIRYVFCEDSSSFYEREKCRRFVIESDSPFNRRFVRYFKGEGINYQPRVRLL